MKRRVKIFINCYPMIKNFPSPQIKIWFEPMFFYWFFCGFERCGSLSRASHGRAIGHHLSVRQLADSGGGIPSPPAAAKCAVPRSKLCFTTGVRTNSRILHRVLYLIIHKPQKRRIGHETGNERYCRASGEVERGF